MSDWKEERAARKAALKAEKAAQRERDDERLNDLEIEHGDDEVRPVRSKSGLIVIGRPKKSAIDRYHEMIIRDGKPDAVATRKRQAAHQLARACLLYPEKADYDTMVERHAGIPTQVAAACLEFADFIYEEEGKE